jgi:hypothetical protein
VIGKDNLLQYCYVGYVFRIISNIGLFVSVKVSFTVHQLFVNFQKAYDSVRRKVFTCNILIEFGVPMKLVRLIKMCLNKMYSKVRIGKHLSDNFPIQNGLKQGDPFQLCFRICY